MGAAVDEPDPTVVEAARRGDPAAFEELVRAYQPHAWRLCFHLSGDAEVASDITQEAFVRVYRFLPRYRGESKFGTWLFSIVRRCALDELRRSARRKRIADRLRSQPQPLGRASDDAPSGIEVREAVVELPMDLREPVVLIDMLGESYRDVAAVLGVPEGTIKSRVHRARQLLLEMLRADDRERSDEA